MTRKVIHVALNGITSRMGYRQHLVRSLLAIREQGGVRLEDGTTLYPTTHIPRRWDESSRPYEATADDALYAVLEFASGAFASVNSSWTVRVNRRELLELQVDGTDASAVAGLRDCAVQHRVSTPMPVWNPDLPDPIDYQALWSDVPDNMTFDNGFKVEWELFLKCAWQGRPFAWDLVEGAKGVQLASLARQSSAQGRRLDVLPLAV